MKDVQNRERTAPAKPLVAIGELQFDYVSSKNDRSNKKAYFDLCWSFVFSYMAQNLYGTLKESLERRPCNDQIIIYRSSF